MACLIAVLSLSVGAATGDVRGHDKASKGSSAKGCGKKAARRGKQGSQRARAKTAKLKRRAVKCAPKKRPKTRSKDFRIVSPTTVGEVSETAATGPSPQVTPAAQEAPPAVPEAPAVPSPALLFSPNYDLGLTSWQGAHQPAGTQRLTTTTAPGIAGSAYRPSGKVMRAELQAGDVTNTGGYVAPRAEVYGRWMEPTTAPESWPDPVGSERWYAFDLFVPIDFPTATDTRWLTLTQWKGQHGGSPPVALEINRNDLRVGGAQGWNLPSGNLGPLEKGQWTRLVVGMKFSPDPTVGWIEVYRNGVLKVVRTPLATMDRTSTGADPVYLKQGLYRSSQWNVTHVLYFSPVKVFAGGPSVDPLTLG